MKCRINSNLHAFNEPMGVKLMFKNMLQTILNCHFKLQIIILKSIDLLFKEEMTNKCGYYGRLSSLKRNR